MLALQEQAEGEGSQQRGSIEASSRLLGEASTGFGYDEETVLLHIQQGICAVLSLWTRFRSA